MNKALRFVFIALLTLGLLLLCGCVDFYYNRRPQMNENERWVAEEIEMYFKWDEEENFVGELTVDGKAQKILVAFDYGTGIEVYPFVGSKANLRNRLFYSNCDFGKDKIVTTMQMDDADLFDGELPTITFVRQEDKGTVLLS